MYLLAVRSSNIISVWHLFYHLWSYYQKAIYNIWNTKQWPKPLLYKYNRKHLNDTVILALHQHENKFLNCLDINITNTINNKYEFKVHRTKAITNIHIKQTSRIDPSIIKSVFKGFLHRAHSICSEKYIKEKEKFLIDMCAENGHNKQLLKNLAIKYNNEKNNKNNHENNTENRAYKNLKKLPWIPNISPKVKRELKKIRKDIAFTSGKNLQQILCQKNKPNLLPNSQPGVCQLDCSCNSKYIGESKKRVFTRCIEHQQVAWVENGDHLGLQNIQKNAMDNSTGSIRKQYAFHHTFTKGKSAKCSK